MRNQLENRDSIASEASPILQWPLPTAFAQLAQSEIHLWCVPLGLFSKHMPQFKAWLSPDELARAHKFHFEKDRQSFVVRRGVLRLLLGRYLERLPESLKFRYAEAGKPEVESDSIPIYFNSSHSAGVALIGVSAACPIGVDIECMRPVSAMEDIAARFFSSPETRKLLALPRESRLEGFYSCWTRKEALLKATGQGISNDLANVEVTLAPGEDAAVAHWAGQLEEGRGWSLRSASPANGYLAAAAFKHSGLSLRVWTVPLAMTDQLSGAV